MTFNIGAEDWHTAAAPEPLFILSAQRSFSSVVCGMLGQHPQCYGLPELNLFLGDDLAGYLQFTAPFPWLRHGLLRALAYWHETEQNDDTIARAHEWVVARSTWPIKRVFDYIQDRAGSKMLVEKSPATMFRGDFLERLLRTFPNAKLLHLIRHPRSMGESAMKLRVEYEELRGANNNPQLDPERVWRSFNELIVIATEDLSMGQCMRLKGEALLCNLDVYLPQICEWLGLRRDAEAIEAMMHPEHSPFAHLGPSAAKWGNDPNFLAHPKLDRKRLKKMTVPKLDGELSWRKGEMFEHATRKLAKQLGYQ
jgi:Sulfotransferase family